MGGQWRPGVKKGKSEKAPKKDVGGISFRWGSSMTIVFQRKGPGGVGLKLEGDGNPSSIKKGSWCETGRNEL